MKSIWQIIITWLKQNALPVFNDLLSGVDASELSAAENKIGAPFPEDLKKSLSIYNGQEGGAAPLLENWQLVSVEGIVKNWELLKRVSEKWQGGDAAKETSWNNKMIPILYNGAGDFMCINLDKGNKTYGEIKIYSHIEGLDKKVQARSYKELLEIFASNLEAGKYKYEDDEIIKIK